MNELYVYREAFRAFQRAGIPPDPDLLRLLADLASLADERDKGCTAEAFCVHLLAALRQDAMLAQSARVCIAQFAPGLPMLQVVGSANAVVAGPNILRTGYYCFINPAGSLLKVREGRARIYGDARAVTGAFACEGRPSQRTIRLISEMGMRAGLGMPLRAGGAQGTLFLNTTAEGSFAELDDSRHLALSFIAQMAAHFLHRPPVQAPAEPGWSIASVKPGEFAAGLAVDLRQRFGARAVLHAGQFDEVGYIWSVGAARWLAVQSIDALSGPGGPGAVEIGSTSVSRDLLSVDIRMDTACTALDERLAGLRTLLAPWRAGIVLAPLGGGFHLHLPADRDFHADAQGCYSV
jgi:hypothetical protein